MSDKNIHQKNEYFFVSFNSDRGLSLDNKTKYYVHRNTVGLVHSLHEVPQLGEHIGLQNMKIGEKTNFGPLATIFQICSMDADILS